MRVSPTRWRRAGGRSIWAFVGFLALFLILLLVVTHFYLLRVLPAFRQSDEQGRRLIAVQATLLMFVILAILGASLMLIFRIGRYFFPPKREKPGKTVYTDAWAESGKRMKPPGE